MMFTITKTAFLMTSTTLVKTGVKLPTPASAFSSKPTAVVSAVESEPTATVMPFWIPGIMVLTPKNNSLAGTSMGARIM